MTLFYFMGKSNYHFSIRQTHVHQMNYKQTKQNKGGMIVSWSCSKQVKNCILLLKLFQIKKVVCNLIIIIDMWCNVLLTAFKKYCFVSVKEVTQKLNLFPSWYGIYIRFFFVYFFNKESVNNKRLISKILFFVKLWTRFFNRKK